jgi:hypothetical protein
MSEFFQHLNVKIPALPDAIIDPNKFIVVFHRWIRDSKLPGVLIDVADYKHVPNGPGILLIGHEANYSMDHAGGIWGGLYAAKAKLEGTASELLTAAFDSALNLVTSLEAEPELADDVTFSRGEYLLTFNDRALTPNDDATVAALKPDLAAFLDERIGKNAYILEKVSTDPRERLSFKIVTQ